MRFPITVGYLAQIDAVDRSTHTDFLVAVEVLDEDELAAFGFGMVG